MELIRNEDVWEKTKEEIEKKKLPKTIEFLAQIAGIFAGNVISEMNSWGIRSKRKSTPEGATIVSPQTPSD